MIPLFEILFFITVNLVPKDAQSLSIVMNGTQTIQLTKQKDGGWENKTSENYKGIWSAK
jgi:hypothetical protein